MYARLSAGEQHRVYQPHRGRRIVLATNVAETSLTVPGIRYVIDPGTARISRYSRRTKVQRLPIEAVSQASANQRAGRCGRLGPGICIRLYSEAEVDRLREVMRLRNLLGVSLEQLKTLLAAEDARAVVRAELKRDDVDPGRRRELLTEGLGHIDRQLQLVNDRSAELENLKRELLDTRSRVRHRLGEADDPATEPAVRATHAPPSA